MRTLAERRQAFRALHAEGCFLLPNPWDAETARRLERAGFAAIASTSAGAAWALGKQDGELTLAECLDHLSRLTAACDLPLNADFEDGFADSLAGLGETVPACVATGVAGLSIEDRRGGALYDPETAAARVAASREAIRRTGADVILVARCEAYLMDPLDLDAVIRRLSLYAEAGADCVYAPGLRRLDQIRAVAAAVPRPLNANLSGEGFSLAALAAAGARRVSLAAELARETYAAFDRIAARLLRDGRLPGVEAP